MATEPADPPGSAPAASPTGPAARDERADGAPPQAASGAALRPAPEPVQVDAARIVAAGTIIWFAGFVVLLPFWSWLDRHDHLLWLWTCLAASGLGLIGLLLIRRHRGQGRVA
jgi:hypothetical protein